MCEKASKCCVGILSARRGCGRRQRFDDDDQSIVTATEPHGSDANPEHLFECERVEEGQEPQTPVSQFQSQEL